ncbi:MAG: helix-hairpin-helix domain-containing protein, partial [Photobacterium frigidiphilum]
MIRALFITLLFLLPFTTQATTSSAQAKNDSLQNTSTKMHGNTESRKLEDAQKKNAVTKNLKAVNVNSASAKDLAASLPGIGDA